MTAQETTHAIGLFSGGLDSILAIKLVQEQGIKVTALHFVSPFFGKPEKIPHWEKVYGFSIRTVDISDDYIAMMKNTPAHGFGSVLNPCVDCKILMLRHARQFQQSVGADFIVTGEVLGQRPMSQRRDTLNVIRRDADVKDTLLRPLSAHHFDPVGAERTGMVDRSLLQAISGRGRKKQMALAEHFGITEIPTPGGGCLLTEKENARSYWPVLQYAEHPCAIDFRIANTGRQFWHRSESSVYWLVVGRNQEDNTALLELAGEKDLMFKTRDFPSPVALARYLGREWTRDAVQDAAAFAASYSNKAVRYFNESEELVSVRVHLGSLDSPGEIVEVIPSRATPFAWAEYTWEEARVAIKMSRSGIAS